MNKIVIANFKSNLLKDDITNYIDVIKSNSFNNLDLVFCPSNIYLDYFTESGFNTGSQDVSVFNSGSYTGEVNALQLNSIRVKYGLVGHSERRKYFNDEDYLATKLAHLIANNIIPILCVGEQIEDRNQGNTENVIRKQLDDAFIQINNIDINKIIIAYEPIWSIGTNVIPSNDQIEDVVMTVQDYIRLKYDASVRIVYGGSVNLNNIDNLNLISSLDGYLIGGSSIDVNNYISLLQKLI